MIILSPKVITGHLNQQNKGACDWGWQGFVAYGCQSYVVVIDPTHVQVIQCLRKHNNNVVKVKWAKENYSHELGCPYSLRLVSADSGGQLICWDVAGGKPKAEFSDGTKPVQDLEWVPNQDTSHDLLVALHPPYSFILWNGDTGTKLWKKSYTEILISLSFDPFSDRNIAFLGQECILFVEDFSVTKTPSSNGKKYFISSPSYSTGTLRKEGSSTSLDKKATSSTLAKRMTKMLVGESSGKRSLESEFVMVNECLQLVYHKSCRHHLILLYPREILLLDLEINQTVGIIGLDRAGSSFAQIIPLRQRDVLMCLHENGSISVRVRRKTNVINTPAPEGVGAFDDSPPAVSMDVAYDLRCQSDSLRITRHSKVANLACCPVNENSAAMVTTDGRVIFWDLVLFDCPVKKISSHSPLYTPGSTCDLDEMSNTSLKSLESSCSVPLISQAAKPRMALCDMIGQCQSFAKDTEGVLKGHGVAMKFLMTGLMNGLMPNITVIKMCPPLTTKNWWMYEPNVAVGNQAGLVQIINLKTGSLRREYNLFASPVRGLDWCSMYSILAYSYPNPGVSGLVKNDVQIVDLLSGKVRHIRNNKDNEPPIDFVRTSYTRHYLVIVFKEKPLELWDLKNLTLIREMGKGVPRATMLEWSPSHSWKSSKKKSVQHQVSVEKEVGATGVTESMVTSSLSEGTESQESLNAKEHLVFTDMDGTIYHFVVEGSSFSDASKFPGENGLSLITAIAWKSDYILYGDTNGSVCVWDLNNKITRVHGLNRGPIKKIKFGPGKGNYKFLVLFPDGLEIKEIDGAKLESVSHIRFGRDVEKIIDAEWGASDRCIFATVDGCLVVSDVSLTCWECPTNEWMPIPFWSPYTINSKAALITKFVLQSQAWLENYTLQMDTQSMPEDIASAVNTSLSQIDNEIKSYLPLCRFGVAERCIIVARLFGDENDLLFWTVALYYLKKAKRRKSTNETQSQSGRTHSDMFIPRNSSVKETDDLVVLDHPEKEKNKNLQELFVDTPLERHFDAICDNESFKKYQLDRIALHDSKRATYDHTKKCMENYIMLGDRDRAVQLLLETEPDNETYYIDSLRACLVASIRSSGASQSTIKLVATNLIANGKLNEGVQLLCLIEKVLDACRYLQTYGEWDKSVWLAKSMLSTSESYEVMKRWTEHLCSTHVNQKSKAVLVMLSLGQFDKVIEMLFGMRQFNRAAQFCEAINEFGLVDERAEIASLVEAVYLEYSRLWMSLGYKPPAEHYCKQAGNKGVQLLKEIEFLFS